MYTAKEVGELLGEVFCIACRALWKCAKYGVGGYVALHFIVKYW